MEIEVQKINKQLQQIRRTLRSLMQKRRLLQELSRIEQQRTDVCKKKGIVFNYNIRVRDTADAVVAEWMFRISS